MKSMTASNIQVEGKLLYEFNVKMLADIDDDGVGPIDSEEGELMLLRKKKGNVGSHIIRNYLKNRTFQKFMIGILTILIALAIVENGAVPKKYNLKLLDKSPYDINAPRDIENTLKTEQNALDASDSVLPVMKKLDGIPIDVLIMADDFMSEILNARSSVNKSLQEQGIANNNKNYKQILEDERKKASETLSQGVKEYSVSLYDEQVQYLVAKANDEELRKFKELTKELIKNIMTEEITDTNLANKIEIVVNDFQNSQQISNELKNIGSVLVKSILKPNSIVDAEQTDIRKKEAYDSAMKSKVIIKKDARILSYGDVVLDDKLQVLDELKLLETGKFDYTFALGILAILLLLASLLILYMYNFCKKIFSNRNELILLSVVILLTLLVARVVYIYSTLLIPVFIAAMLISILLDLKLAIIVNLILSIAISFITKGDLGFLYMSIISGTFAAFAVYRTNQRSRLSAAGLIIAGVNILIIVCMGIINKSDIRTLANNSLIVSLNGIVSIVFTIGMLPFFESTFNVITPLKLLELANPNQPLIKRLLMEAPGTYHHSLMVGNLAEVATEAIEGNALLARVGAYYHDIGKLRRPNFFKENQMSDNPHDKMTANLSTLVITSHTQDGIEMAEKLKIPQAITDIISQHHGNTLVAYFYHKAKKQEKGEDVKQEDFRYEGPRPTSKEAAVVLLADSVEAAVRSMDDKTVGKIEGFVRKIIKDKLDDGQLDLCDLTLKDLDIIAKSFMRVFSGYFHEREEYPDIKERDGNVEKRKITVPMKNVFNEQQDEVDGRTADDCGN